MTNTNKRRLSYQKIKDNNRAALIIDHVVSKCWAVVRFDIAGNNNIDFMQSVCLLYRSRAGKKKTV